ncbi:MAG TPA: hypothetical protein VM784_08290 [Actinomycetota bacterium]|nr:hypothetical protein [Actinomycetota bacterium]
MSAGRRFERGVHVLSADKVVFSWADSCRTFSVTLHDVSDVRALLGWIV